MKIEKSSKTPKLLSKCVSFRRAKRAGNFGIKSFTWEETKIKIDHCVAVPRVR